MIERLAAAIKKSTSAEERWCSMEISRLED
jgi:hypothetical protein